MKSPDRMKGRRKRNQSGIGPTTREERIGERLISTHKKMKRKWFHTRKEGGMNQFNTLNEKHEKLR